MKPGGPVQQPYSYSIPSPQRLLKNSSTETSFFVDWSDLMLGVHYFTVDLLVTVILLKPSNTKKEHIFDRNFDRCTPEMVFLNLWGAQESIPPAYVAWRAGVYDNPIPTYSVPSPHRLF